MAKPTDYPNIPSLHEETEIYTQRRTSGEAPANYKFTIQDLVSFIGSGVQPFTDVVNINSAYSIGHRFNLTYTPVSEHSVLVIFNGQTLIHGVDYNVDVGNKQIELLFSGDPSGETDADTFMVRYNH